MSLWVLYILDLLKSQRRDHSLLLAAAHTP
jgi:hypothetical protein